MHEQLEQFNGSGNTEQKHESTAGTEEMQLEAKQTRLLV